MDWNALSPYFVPLFVAAFLLRRAFRVQKAKRVRFASLWIFPILLILVTMSSLSREESIGVVALAAFVASALGGAALGWFRVHTLEFSVDPDTGRVSARANQWGALLVIALIVLRYLAGVALKKFGLGAGASLVHATDAMLVFTTAMMVARNVHTWMRARAALTAQRNGTGAGANAP